MAFCDKSKSHSMSLACWNHGNHNSASSMDRLYASLYAHHICLISHISIYPFICGEMQEWHPKYPVEVFKIIHAQQEWPRANESDGFSFRFDFFRFFFFISFRHSDISFHFFHFFHVVFHRLQKNACKDDILCKAMSFICKKKNIYIIQGICPLNCEYKCVKLS